SKTAPLSGRAGWHAVPTSSGSPIFVRIASDMAAAAPPCRRRSLRWKSKCRRWKRPVGGPILTAMGNAIDIAAVGALVGDPARANMLAALVDGGALPASDLAYAAGVSPQTASWHLGNLAEGGLLA